MSLEHRAEAARSNSKPVAARPPGLLISGVVLLALGVVEAAIIASNVLAPPWQGMDYSWRQTMEGSRDGTLTAFARIVDFVGGPVGGIVILLALIGVFVYRGRQHAALFLAVGTVATTVVAQVTKKIVDRPRPLDPLVRVDHGSFPSGHMVFVVSTAIMLVAVLTIAGRSRLGVILTVAATALIVWNRTYLGAHWLSDTIGGLLLGGGTTLVLWWLMTPYLSAEKPVDPNTVNPNKETAT
ncbi:membrane-associated phospholipid phosphatase [Mycobacterium frederiksbergense]|uniref:Membrane-associated phospholipid phosphatase n=1 Tax=Mycolicibacterium frederiksbergense TaxID=117567 RepID=A0ABT6KTK9_9MYCO|nr:phosphatase PAP2 family protein [Mycolicibacterium frederiksbergense]MDH6194046.1 membrane-associated phospholipid phosphatase [Mycolicibacterium frederiksbergense]